MTSHQIARYKQLIQTIGNTKIEPDSKRKRADYWFGMGCAYGEHGLKEYRHSVHAFSKCLVLVPDHVRAYVHRAAGNEHLGQLERAISDYTSALVYAPTEARWYECRAQLYEQLNQWSLAKADWDKAKQHAYNHSDKARYTKRIQAVELMLAQATSRRSLPVSEFEVLMASVALCALKCSSSPALTTMSC